MVTPLQEKYTPERNGRYKPHRDERGNITGIEPAPTITIEPERQSRLQQLQESFNNFPTPSSLAVTPSRIERIEPPPGSDDYDERQIKRQAQFVEEMYGRGFRMIVAPDGSVTWAKREDLAQPPRELSAPAPQPAPQVIREIVKVPTERIVYLDREVPVPYPVAVEKLPDNHWEYRGSAVRQNSHWWQRIVPDHVEIAGNSFQDVQERAEKQGWTLCEEHKINKID